MGTRQERSEQSAKEYFLEQASAYFDEMKHATANAPHGHGLNYAEAFVLSKGRELLQQSLETVLQEQIDEFEKKRRNTAHNANHKPEWSVA
jgi:hypothetical protein